MCIFRMRTSTELDGLVARAEFNVEPGDKGVHEVVAACGEREGLDEGEIRNGNSVEVEGDERMRVGHDCLHFNGVDKGFRESGVLEWGVVKAPDVVPD